MNIKKLQDSIIEAIIFIRKADKLLELEMNKKKPYNKFPKESGSVRRASVDLTRSLADLRKYND